MERQQYLPFVTSLPTHSSQKYGKATIPSFFTSLPTHSSQQYKPLNFVVKRQEWFAFTVLSSGKLFRTAVSNISIAKSSWEVSGIFVRFEPDKEFLDRFS